MTKQRFSHVESHGVHLIHHYLIFNVSFAQCIFAGMVIRLQPNFWCKASSRSLLTEAWDASITITYLAFAG